MRMSRAEGLDNSEFAGGNMSNIIRLYDKVDGELRLVDEVEATHIGCEYGEYDEEHAE